jgi:hypothetical protein
MSKVNTPEFDLSTYAVMFCIISQALELSLGFSIEFTSSVKQSDRLGRTSSSWIQLQTGVSDVSIPIKYSVCIVIRSRSQTMMLSEAVAKTPLLVCVLALTYLISKEG